MVLIRYHFCLFFRFLLLKSSPWRNPNTEKWEVNAKKKAHTQHYSSYNKARCTTHTLLLHSVYLFVIRLRWEGVSRARHAPNKIDRLFSVLKTYVSYSKDVLQRMLHFLRRFIFQNLNEYTFRQFTLALYSTLHFWHPIRLSLIQGTNHLVLFR